MADNTNNSNNSNNTQELQAATCYKITICGPDGKEDVYETNVAFLICDVGDRIEAAQLCRNAPAFDVFQLVKVGQRAILEMIPEKHRRIYEAFVGCTEEDEEDDEE